MVELAASTLIRQPLTRFGRLNVTGAPVADATYDGMSKRVRNLPITSDKLI